MAALSEAEVSACTHPRQFPRFLLALVFCLALAPILAAGAALFTAILLLPLLVLAVWLARETAYAHFRGNAIMVSELNYPRIHNLTQELKETLGVTRNVYVFVYEQGSFNAFLMRLFFRRAVFLNSEILETGVSDDEVRWLVGRFVGYLRCQRRSGPAGWLIRMTQQLGFTGVFTLPYDRAMVYTGDRLALAAIGGDISTAASAMQKLFVGRLLGYSVNPVGLVEQHRQIKGSLFGFWARLASPFPHMTARFVDLVAFAKRRYPEQFERFEAANPGLAPDIDQLSAEHYSGADVAKGLAVYGGLYLLVSAALIFDIVAYGPVLRKLDQASASDTNAISEPGPASNDTSATNTLTPEEQAQQAAAAQEAANEAAAATESAEQQNPSNQAAPPETTPPDSSTTDSQSSSGESSSSSSSQPQN